MENFLNILFYLTGIVCALCCIWCIFEKNIKRFNIIYLIFALLVALLLFMLKAPALAVLQGLIFGILAFVILNSIAKATVHKDKKALVVNYKTVTTPFFAAAFVIVLIPFILYVFKGFNTLNPAPVFDFIPLLFKTQGLLIIVSIFFLIAVLLGIASIFGVKNVYKKMKTTKNGEEAKC